jgi:hypothetical protein
MVIQSEDLRSQLELRPTGVGGNVITCALSATGPHTHCTRDEVAFLRADLWRFSAEIERLMRTAAGSVTLCARTPGTAELHLMSGGWTRRLALHVKLGWDHAIQDVPVHDRLALTLEVTPEVVAAFAAELGATASLRLGQRAVSGAKEHRWPAVEDSGR